MKCTDEIKSGVVDSSNMNEEQLKKYKAVFDKDSKLIRSLEQKMNSEKVEK